MAYMRGDYYIWTDSSDVHFWSASGYDAWDRASWHVGEDGDVRPGHMKLEQCVASGVSVPQEVADEYVVMRLAQMIKDNSYIAAIDRALDPDGRGDKFGSRILAQYAERLKQSLRDVRHEDEPVLAGVVGAH
jgi:hypothetical protein